MQSAVKKLADIWGLHNLSYVADTGHAQVWKVQTANGSAALKFYHRTDRGNEAAGTTLLKHWENRGAVQILAEAQNAVLMEWLEGPSLGDIARAGQPGIALASLADTARRLHHMPLKSPKGLKPLSDVFEPLFSCRFLPDCTAALQCNMKRAISLARRLLDTQVQTVALHGDLHPDNVIQTAAGPRVIDAKGYLGDPAFELANALRHPKGMPSLVQQRRQIKRCLKLYADALLVSEDRLAKWAAAKCALSIFWRSHGSVETDREADLLHLFLDIADQ